MRGIHPALLILTILCSCSNHIIPGEYVYHNYHIFIDSNLNYKFKSYSHFSIAFSSGKIEQHKDTIIFKPDSAYFFKITKIESAYTPSLNKQIRLRIISDSSNKTPLDYYSFSCLTWDLNKYTVDSNYEVFIPDSVDISTIGFYVKPNLGGAHIVPTPAHDSLYTQISKDDIGSIYPRHWNDVKVTLLINNQMFNFVVLDNKIKKNGKLIAIDYPVYQLKTGK